MLLACLCFVGAAVAWFSEAMKIRDMIINTGTVEAEFSLYKYVDFNCDGMIDVDFSTGQPLYAEVDEIVIQNFVPGDTHTYRVEISNNSVGRAGYDTIDIVLGDRNLPEFSGGVIRIGRRYLNSANQLVDDSKIINRANDPDNNGVIQLGADVGQPKNLIASNATAVVDLYITFLATADLTYAGMTFSITQIEIMLNQA
jgi:hypothetical protein